MAEMIRSFIAIPLDEAAKSALARVQDTLREAREGRIGKWVRPEGIHLTLKFLGDVPAPRIPEIAEAMASVCHSQAPFQLTLTGLGCFPNLRRPRVVWVGIKGDLGPLHALQKGIEEAMNALGYPPEGRAFSPHLTLARVERGARPQEIEALGKLVERTEVGELARLSVTRVHLMRSDLKPTGAVYTELAVATLGD